MGVIAMLLVGTAALLALETVISGIAWTLLAHESAWRGPASVVADLLVGTISSMLGVAGGELIIPILVFVFGADIRTAGTASVLISLPIVLAGVTQHWLTGHYRSQSMLVYLVLPMSIGSLVGALVDGYLAAWAPTDALRITLAAILAVSAIKLWTKSVDLTSLSGPAGVGQFDFPALNGHASPDGLHHAERPRALQEAIE